MVLIAAVYDVRYRRIPNWLTAGGVLIGLAMNTFLSGWPGQGTFLHDGWPGLRLGLVGFGIAFAVNFVMYLLHFRGAGDVKLMAAIGATVGWANWFGIFLLSAIVAGLLSLIVVFARKRAKTTFWNVTFLISELASGRAPHLKREELDVSSGKASRIPAGATIAIGTVFFLAVAAHFTQ
ncbi:MAG: A24 family peptidase [Acidobacteriia bacterium]|nr:A24 family peptidase [Terriglobia bacterium]